jgi:hypothetical protein
MKKESKGDGIGVVAANAFTVCFEIYLLAKLYGILAKNEKYERKMKNTSETARNTGEK